MQIMFAQKGLLLDLTLSCETLSRIQASNINRLKVQECENKL